MILLISFHYKFASALIGLVALLILVGHRSSRDLFKHFFYNAAAIALALAIFEAYLTYREVKTDAELTCERSIEGPGGQKLAVYDQELGYKPAEAGVFRARKYDVHNGRSVFDVMYSLSGHQRVTPSSNPAGARAFIFVGCSNTFGYGLEDSETLPQQFGVQAGSRHQIENLGFNGYGCHQVYQQALTLPPASKSSTIIYSFLFGHISRAAGYSAWDRQGPKFTLIDGVLHHQGSFEKKADTKLMQLIDKVLLRSRTYKHFFKQFFRPITDQDMDRAAALIIATRQILEEKGYQMLLFIHDIEEHIQDEFRDQNKYDQFIRQIVEGDVTAGFLSEVIYDYDQNIDQYTHGSCDRHPNKQANNMIASYFVEVLNAGPTLAENH